MKKKDWYENWFSSAYYKILYQDRDELEAEEFVHTLINHLQPLPGSKMLDIACGEGRFAIQLEEKGYDVTGIDLSEESITKAKAQENEHLHFYVHDMRFPFYINYFDYAFNFFTSFGYFGKERDHVMAAKSFAKALKKDGLLVIDYMNATKIVNELIPEATVVRGDYTFHISKRVEDGHIIKDIRFKDKEGNDQHFAERVATFGLSDFISMFKKAGMTLSGTYGDYMMREYNPIDSPRLIMIFRK